MVRRTDVGTKEVIKSQRLYSIPSRTESLSCLFSSEFSSLVITNLAASSSTFLRKLGDSAFLMRPSDVAIVNKALFLSDRFYKYSQFEVSVASQEPDL